MFQGKGKREYLNDAETRDLMKKLDTFYKSKVEIPRKKVGRKQKNETLINEETLLLVKFLRIERKMRIPRLITL